MNFISKFLVLLVYLYLQYFLSSYTTANDSNTLRFTNLECLLNHEYFAEKQVCKLKPYRNRTVSALLKFVIIKEIPHFFVNFELFVRENGYKPSFLNLTQDGCRFFENKNANPFMKVVFKWIASKTYPEQIRCPVQKDKLEFYDIIPDLADIPSLVPTGDFLLMMRFYDFDPDITYVTLKVYVNIGIKNLFG